MAYFTGTANNPSDLLAKLRVHAESLGWVTDRARHERLVTTLMGTGHSMPV